MRRIIIYPLIILISLITFTIIAKNTNSFFTPNKAPNLLPTPTNKLIDDISCLSDHDCVLNICACKAINKKYIEQKDRVCTRYCKGEVKCSNKRCELF